MEMGAKKPETAQPSAFDFLGGGTAPASQAAVSDLIDMPTQAAQQNNLFELMENQN